MKKKKFSIVDECATLLPFYRVVKFCCTLLVMFFFFALENGLALDGSFQAKKKKSFRGYVFVIVKSTSLFGPESVWLLVTFENKRTLEMFGKVSSKVSSIWNIKGNEFQ